MVRSSSLPKPRVLVFGAGSVGCYLGGRLAAAGVPVDFVGRSRIGRSVSRHGLSLSDYHGDHWRVPPEQIRFSSAVAGGEYDIVFVTVKTAATPQAGRALARVLNPGAVVIAFQNGLHNGDWLRELLPRCRVLSGMVPFNVLQRGEGRFHQGSSGSLMLEAAPGQASLRTAFARAQLPLSIQGDMRGVLWAKLLLNLNNAINALSGLTLREELGQRDFRRCLAAAQREALFPLSVAGVRLARMTAVPPQWMPKMLELPDRLYATVSAAAPTMDPLARSSMWEDLEAGRATEVEWINGEVIRLARSQGRDAPVNARLMQLVYEAEKGGERAWPATALWRELKAARRASQESRGRKRGQPDGGSAPDQEFGHQPPGDG
ncbi:MAG: 2-dehydropantoate 2-reductase [Sinobacteraceae bacterium]|nr:2-dehydropantoate 2-reductase [Nevskiaceae bacterium]